jgi:hypothetical protein
MVSAEVNNAAECYAHLQYAAYPPEGYDTSQSHPSGIHATTLQVRCVDSTYC